MKIKNNYLFFKPFFQLALGSLIAQIITIIVSPISTRLFSKEQLGMYTLLLTVVSIFSPVLSGRYEMLIVTVKSKEDEYNLIILSLILGVFSSLFISIIYSLYMLNKYANTFSTIFFFLLFCILILTSIVNVLSAFNNKNKEYKLLSTVYVKRTIVQNAMLILTGYFKLGVLGLLLSQVISIFIGVKKQAVTLLKHKKNFKEVKLSSIKESFIEGKNQLIFSTPASLLNTTSYSILNFFISSLYGLKVFGLYSMSYRILGLPLTLISGNISKVYFQQASDELNKRGSYRAILIKYSLLLSFISIIMVTILVIFSPLFFEVFFGKGWGEAGEYVRVLAPMYGIRLIVSSLSVSLIISKYQHLEVVLQILFILGASFTYIVSKSNNMEPIIFLKYISIVYSIIYLLFYLMIFKISGKGENA